MKWLCSASLVLLLTGCSRVIPNGIKEEGFLNLTDQVAQGWNQGDAALAAQCFQENAVYEEPPRKQFYQGRQALYEFFGGTAGFGKPMHMQWHHRAFDQQAQVGFGEYTFSFNEQYHGVVIIQVENGKIKSWREYQYQSSQPWQKFIGESRFR